jgi:hypothetical protein
MLTRAQCEKAVTISEQVGYSGGGVRISLPVKAPMAACVLRCLWPAQEAFRFSSAAALHLVFNDLRAGVALTWKRLRRSPQYLPNRAFVLLQDSWFGPNFVTILAKGVRVCSY